MEEIGKKEGRKEERELIGECDGIGRRKMENVIESRKGVD